MIAIIGPWVALIAFWCLLAVAWVADEPELRWRVGFVVIWAVANVAFRYLGYSALFPSFVALLDVAMVLMIFKGDVRLS